NVVIKQKGRSPHAQTRSRNQPSEARKRALMPAELEADRRERIYKKLTALVDQRTKNRKPRK
ncbi:IS3 family transposase, partial [Lactobacillus sp. B4010]|nr:IS3 family transposase [Lactobacillus sp. B4010]